jgi:hypothetical protein
LKPTERTADDKWASAAVALVRQFKDRVPPVFSAASDDSLFVTGTARLVEGGVSIVCT